MEQIKKHKCESKIAKNANSNAVITPWTNMVKYSRLDCVTKSSKHKLKIVQNQGHASVVLQDAKPPTRRATCQVATQAWWLHVRRRRVTVPRCVTEVVHETLGSLSRGRWRREDGRLESHDTSQESEDIRKKEKDKDVLDPTQIAYFHQDSSVQHTFRSTFIKQFKLSAKSLDTTIEFYVFPSLLLFLHSTQTKKNIQNSQFSWKNANI